jgi:excisionase family DNA binding protein
MTRMSVEVVELYTPAEVAAMFRVDPKTVTRWHQAGKLACIRTLGGHRRYLAQEVRALLRLQGVKTTPIPATGWASTPML